MKKIALLFLVLASAFGAQAAPGDTTWVQAQGGTQLSNYGDYDSPAAFPDGSKSYRRVFMYFTLGKYTCPSGSQYCADWDYTVQTYLMTPAGDTFELGRLITPYANSLRMTASWKGVYTFDVTDYYPVLQNNATIRVHYSGYSGGFTADVKFAFIEGTPARNVLGITRVWKNDYNYGHGSVDINTALSNVSLTAPANTQSAEAKFTITGHGGDAQNCAEFCPNTYTMNLNNNQLVQQNFWRANCGYNNYYPQNGTWVFDRAGWCPGDKILPYSHTLTGITSGSNYMLNVTFPAYTSVPSSNGSQAVYTIESAVIYYGGFNNTLNASLEDIMAPTNNEAYFRMNPVVGKPTIKVKNTGSTAISSLKLEYGVAGSAQATTYTWNGTINALEEKEITLPEPWSLRVATGSNNIFTAKILEVNGQADQDATDNELSSTFTAAPVWSVKFRITLKTNGSIANGVSETNWKIYDVFDNVVAQRINNAANTTYEDTVTLGPASYRFEVNDAGCDGVNWWLYQYYNPNPGTGSVQVRPLNSGIPFNLKGYYGGDFGCGFTQYFRTDWPTEVQDIAAATISMEAYPNPAQQTATIAINGMADVSGQLQIRDAVGRVVLEMPAKATNNVNVAQLSNGVYNVIFTGKGAERLQTRLLIAR